MSIVTHFENFGKGVLDSKDVIFYLSLIFFALVPDIAIAGIEPVEGIT